MTVPFDNFHVLRQNDNLNMQRFFAFVDTEANIRTEGTTQYQTFKLGSAIFWDRETGQVDRLPFTDVKAFWDALLLRFEGKCRRVIVYAHNMGYDIRLLNGWPELTARGWQSTLRYAKDGVFIQEWKRGKDRLSLWDTFNYFPSSLAELGHAVGLEKLGTFADHETEQEKADYCMNDTEIIFRAIKGLVEFLTADELTKLMPTGASLALNCFRHKFYEKRKKPIYIHSWYNAIGLERDSYSGGIADGFRIGTFTGRFYQLDINSMYPHIMRELPVPTKLIIYTKDQAENPYQVYQDFKDTHLVIAKARIRLPEEFAYVLTRIQVGKTNKCGFQYGDFEASLCGPELDFVEKHGKILSISEIAVYEGDVAFKEYVDYFYSKRREFKASGNDMYQLFCKRFMNTLYGKFAQKEILASEVTKDSDLGDQYQAIKDFGGEPEITDALTGQTTSFMDLEQTVFASTSTDNNAKDSFVAISSYITSYARMLLVKYILQAGRKHVYYCDTDSLIVDQAGYDALASVIDNGKLGYLKVEGTSESVTITKPKDYQAGEKTRLKGISKGAELVSTDDTESLYQQQQFEGFNMAMKKGHFDTVVVTQIRKKVTKKYDKGRVDQDGYVHPFKADG